MGIIEFLKTMSIRNKIKVISVFPLIFIIILSFFLNFNTYKKVNQLEDMKELANLNVKISLLLHEMHISELPDSDAGVVPDTFAMRFSRV